PAPSTLFPYTTLFRSNLRSVICIPLRKAQFRDKALTESQQAAETLETRGVLYLDSHTLSGKLSQVNHELLRTIAQGAATLLENRSEEHTSELQSRGHL